MDKKLQQYGPRKLVEVFLPVHSISEMAQYEKTLRSGHPSTIHPWWGRRPLGVVRSLIFAQTVNDPCSTLELYPDKTLEQAKLERQKLVELTNQLASWERKDDKELLKEAYKNIEQSWIDVCKHNKGRDDSLFDPEKVPGVYDFFSGSGIVPLEAVRLGLNASGSDLNPVAVMVSKATVDIPSKISVMKSGEKLPIGGIYGSPNDSVIEKFKNDILHYGELVRGKVKEKTAEQYGDIILNKELREKRRELVGYREERLPVLAWMWCRTVRSPNPACHNIHVPLVSNWQLSSNRGKEVWVEPVIENGSYHFKVNYYGRPTHEPTIKKGVGHCILSDTVISKDYIKEEGAAGRLGLKLMAIVCAHGTAKSYFPPSTQKDVDDNKYTSDWQPTNKLTGQNATQMPQYGIETFGDLFNERQLILLNSFSDSIKDIWQLIYDDAIQARLSESVDDDEGARFYADSIVLYLALALDKITATHCQLSRWSPSRTQVKPGLSRNYIPMTWEFPEVNPFAGTTGDYSLALRSVLKGIQDIKSSGMAHSFLADAAVQDKSRGKVVVLDPPFFDNILYADLSEFYYLWMRKTLKPFYGDVLATIETPKSEEIVASRFVHKTKRLAMQKYRDGMKGVFNNLVKYSDESIPFSVFYTYKQVEGKGYESNEYEEFLDGIVQSGFAITSCWPINTELESRKSAQGKNSISSSVVITGRKRQPDAGAVSISQFFRELKSYSSEILEEIQGIESDKHSFDPFEWQLISTIPVLRLFSLYDSVLDSKGNALSLHEVLSISSRKIGDKLLLEVDASDKDTLFCINWFDHYGYSEGKYSEAEMLARTKGVSVNGICEAGVGVTGKGGFRLIAFTEYPADWNPGTDRRLPVWEATHHLLRVFHADGEIAASKLLSNLRKSRKERIIC